MKIAPLACSRALVGILLLSTALSAGAQQVSDSAPPAIQEARRHMLDANVNTLTFHSMDSLFSTRRVARGGTVRAFAKVQRPLDFSYEYKGVKRTGEEALERTFTNALLMIKNGRIVHEEYRNLTDDSTHFISWSMAKSITSLLIGAAVADGSIRSIDDQIVQYVPELKGTDYDGVTIREALEMRSGVGWEERYDFGAHPSPAAQIFEDALVEGRKRYADAALSLKRAHEPGQVFNYSTVETAVLGWVLERATKRPVASYMAEKLWAPIGGSRGRWFLDRRRAARHRQGIHRCGIQCAPPRLWSPRRNGS